MAEPDHCWPWTGAISRNGYGSIKINGKAASAHRVAVPEWKPRIAEMASVSQYWKELAEHWQELETLLREETGLKQDRRGKATKTYDKMKAILDPLEKADRNVFRMGDGVTIRFGA